MNRFWLFLLSSCAGVTVHDVEDAFRRETHAIQLRAPSRADLDPARASNAPGVMPETVALAKQYLARKGQAETAPVAMPVASGPTSHGVPSMIPTARKIVCIGG